MTEAQKQKNSVFYKCGLEISKSCTNTSTAKYTFSFSKAPRFPGVPSDPKELKIKREKEREEKQKILEEEALKKKEGKYTKHDYYQLILDMEIEQILLLVKKINYQNQQK